MIPYNTVSSGCVPGEPRMRGDDPLDISRINYTQE